MQWYLKVGVLGGVYIMNAINALIEKKKKKQRAPSTLLPPENTAKEWLSMSQETGWHLDLELPSLWGINYCDVSP